MTDDHRLLECEDHGRSNTVLGINEARWKGMASLTLQSGETVVYSGDDEVHQGGVAIMMGARAKRALMEWTPISKESSQHDSTQNTKS